MMNLRRMAWRLYLLLAAFLSACVAPPPVPAAPPEKVTILFWDQFLEVSDRMDAIVEDFNTRQDRIEVIREPYTVTAMRDIVRTALTSGTGPDIIYYDLGPGISGVLAEAGLLLPLEDIYRERGWDQRIYPWTLERSTFNGHVYGVANELEFIGFYYNRRLFAEHNWQIPVTWEELIALCPAMQAAGFVPIAFTNGPSWPAFHMFSMMLNNKVGRERLTRMIAGRESWDHPDTVDAIQKFFVDMPAAGCFPPDFNAISYEDGLAMLQTGKAVMHPSGTWNVALLADPERTPDPIGFFFLPSLDGGPVVVPGGIGSGWVVNAQTPHREAVLAFIDYLISDNMGQRWLTEIQVVPAFPVNTSDLVIPELLALALDILGQQAETMGYNIDVVVPANFNQVQWDGFAAVIEGVKTPAEVAAELEAAMQEAVAAGEAMDLTR